MAKKRLRTTFLNEISVVGSVNFVSNKIKLQIEERFDEICGVKNFKTREKLNVLTKMGCLAGGTEIIEGLNTTTIA